MSLICLCSNWFNIYTISETRRWYLLDIRKRDKLIDSYVYSLKENKVKQNHEIKRLARKAVHFE